MSVDEQTGRLSRRNPNGSKTRQNTPEEEELEALVFVSFGCPSYMETVPPAVGAAAASAGHSGSHADRYRKHREILKFPEAIYGQVSRVQRSGESVPALSQ
jgi:hypothetical protein